MTNSAQQTSIRTTSDRSTLSKIMRLILALLLGIVAWILFAHIPVTYNDWMTYFKPASLNWLSPYDIRGVYNPPWTFLILYPFAALSAPWGAAGLILISVIGIALYTRSPWKTMAVTTSAPFLLLLVVGQLDGLILYGLMAPYGLGLPIILIKPQGVFMTILRRINRWSLLVITLTVVISVLIWGFWWQNNLLTGIPDRPHNVSLFPYTIIPGVVVAYLGLKRDSDAFLCLASLCFSPFFQTHSILPTVAAIIRETDDWRYWGAVVVGSWVYYLLEFGFLTNS